MRIEIEARKDNEMWGLKGAKIGKILQQTPTWRQIGHKLELTPTWRQISHKLELTPTWQQKWYEKATKTAQNSDLLQVGDKKSIK